MGVWPGHIGTPWLGGTSSCTAVSAWSTPDACDPAVLTLSESTGEVRIDMDLQQTIKGKHVLIIEDIIDSGNTLNNVIRQLETRDPRPAFPHDAILPYFPCDNFRSAAQS